MNDTIAKPFIFDDEPFATTTDGPITYHHKLIQGSEEWLQARLGVLTASEMKLALTPTLKTARNDKIRAHVFQLAAERVTGFTEPHFESYDMARGHIDETFARAAYIDEFGPIRMMGFITNTRHGPKIGYSPDGLVGDDGLWECKSRSPKYQVRTAVQAKDGDSFVPPVEYFLQLQTGLLVAERKWIDFSSYCGGMPMLTMRVWPDEATQAAIIEAAQTIEADIEKVLADYRHALPHLRPVKTERVKYEDYI
ncbi:MAG: YqaJ viral recombinase family protein [Pseudomonadota bacterium]